jgi:hypothetical protein
VADRTRVGWLGPGHFGVAHDLPPQICANSVTVEFAAPGQWDVEANRRPLPERSTGLTIGGIVIGPPLPGQPGSVWLLIKANQVNLE